MLLVLLALESHHMDLNQKEFTSRGVFVKQKLLITFLALLPQNLLCTNVKVLVVH